MSLFNIISRVRRMVGEEICQLCNDTADDHKGGISRLPKTLNLMVNDICNSRCVMCNIWKRKHEKEFTCLELATILNDPFFYRLKHVGVSGGEPTLRQDLTEIFRVIVQKKGIESVSLITNALIANEAISQIEKCCHVCKEARVHFSVMVSLDGIGSVHDFIRGRDRSFASALKVVCYVRDNTMIPLSVACTIVKENVWHLDEVFDFCLEKKVYGRFRIAEFIDRLYNSDLKNTIRNFDEDERYHIALFMSKLELTYEKDPDVIETYKNIRRMVFEGMPRMIGCPYRSVAVGLDSRGNLIFCSPKSPILDSCLKTSALKIYHENIGIRQNIIKEFCGDCIHDYHAPPATASREEAKEESHFMAMFSVKKVLTRAKKTPSAVPQEPDWSRLINPLIIGWYGTETAGDKAILGGIISKLYAANNNSRITIASLFPFVTKRTLYELDINATIVKTYSTEYLQACKSADAVIMGGGPLMDMEPLGFVLEAFLTARQLNILTIVESCGIGPLSEKLYISTVKEILRLSSLIKVRDMASRTWVIKNTGRNDAICTNDPATDFVESWQKANSVSDVKKKQNNLTCFLREITAEYKNETSLNAFLRFKNNFEIELAKMIRYFAEKTGLKPVFMPMHTFVVGMDDRDFARRFVKTHLKGYESELGHKLYSPQDILSVMSTSRFNLCMRFHSVLFAETLGVPFMAIDYTGGGKIKSYLNDRQKNELMINRVALAEGRWREVVDIALSKGF